MPPLTPTGRKRTLFALERDVHEGCYEALRLPAFPPHVRRQLSTNTLA